MMMLTVSCMDLFLVLRYNLLFSPVAIRLSLMMMAVSSFERGEKLIAGC
jgi:hypothetical protein